MNLEVNFQVILRILAFLLSNKHCLPAFVPILLEALLKQEEDQDQDEGAWNVAMAGGTCLGLVARTVIDDIVPLVMHFMQENLKKKPEWRSRETATYAFGSVLEDPSLDELSPIVIVALNFMLSALLKDPNNHVKDTTAWTLGEFLSSSWSAMEMRVINWESCHQILAVLLQSMKDVQDVAAKDIIQALMTVAHREDAAESCLCTAACYSLKEVARFFTGETGAILMQLVPVIMAELHQTLESQKVSSGERGKQNELQGLLCGCLQVIIQKMGAAEPAKYIFMQYADQMMDIFLRVFASQDATIHEEAMLVIGVYHTLRVKFCEVHARILSKPGDGSSKF